MGKISEEISKKQGKYIQYKNPKNRRSKIKNKQVVVLQTLTLQGFKTLGGLWLYFQRALKLPLTELAFVEIDLFRQLVDPVGNGQCHHVPFRNIIGVGEKSLPPACNPLSVGIKPT